MIGFTRLPFSTPSIDRTDVSFDKGHQRLSRYGPLALWAALIFIGSTSLMSGSNTNALLQPVLLWLFPHASEATIRLINFIVIRKSAHFTEYAIFALLAARAFRTSSHSSLRNHWFATSLLLVALYSLSDEFHQSFVPSRTPSIYDSMIDTFGGLVALALIVARKRPGAVGQRRS